MVYERLASRPQCRLGRWKGSLGGKEYLVETTQQTELEAEGSQNPWGQLSNVLMTTWNFLLLPTLGPR